VATLRFASGVSNSPSLEEALETVLSEIESGLGGESVDLAIVFITTPFADDCVEISRAVNGRLHPRCLIGCTGAGIIGSDQEFEEQAALSVLAGSLPDAELTPLYLQQDEIETLMNGGRVPDILNVASTESSDFLLLPDPFSFNTQALLWFLDEHYPGSINIGGLASAGFQPGCNRLFLNDQTYISGAVGVALSGNIELVPIVSQGCRPIGKPVLVTDAHENTIRSLAGQPALELLQEMLEGSPEEDQELAQNALLIGTVIDEYKTDFDQGDFLIRNMIGGDPATGAISINDYVTMGQTVQFQVRDAESAQEDLTCLLEGSGDQLRGRTPAAAAVFNCNGRGARLYGERNRDISMIHDAIGKVPSAGFFCAGEIGPIAGRSFIHGFTSSIGLFVPKE